MPDGSGVNCARERTVTNSLRSVVSPRRTTSSPGPAFGPERRAHERDGQFRSVEQRMARIAIGRNIFGRGEIGRDPLQRDADHFAALDAIDAAIPVRQPLRGDAGERRQHQAHQRQRDDGLDQREAGFAGAMLVDPGGHCEGLCIRRTVRMSDTAPVGDLTRTLTSSGTQGTSASGTVQSPPSGETSTVQR